MSLRISIALFALFGLPLPAAAQAPAPTLAERFDDGVVIQPFLDHLVRSGLIMSASKPNSMIDELELAHPSP